MNAVDVLTYGGRTFLGTLDKFPKDKADLPNACGEWSVRDVVAHMASEAEVLVEVLRGFVGEDGSTPLLNEMADGAEDFNLREVEKRSGKSLAEVRAEYERAHQEALRLIKRIPPKRRREVGTLPWYGPEYSLEDYIVYGHYGHAREHSIHIAAFADVLARM